MTNPLQYCYLSSRCPDPNRSSDAWDGAVFGRIICARCRKVLNPTSGVDVVLDAPPVQTDLNCIQFIKPGIVSLKLKRFLDGYGFSDAFRFGMVRDEAGNEYPDFRTFISPLPIRMRGDHRSTLGRCETCNSVRHYPTGAIYLLRRDYDALSGAPIAQSMNSLIIRSDLWKDGLKDSREWKHLAIERLPVKDNPLDGFPEDLEDFDK